MTRADLLQALAGIATPRYGDEILATLDAQGVGGWTDATAPDGALLKVTWTGEDYRIEEIAPADAE